MFKEKIIMVSNGDDWEGLFMNGDLVMENHKVENIKEIAKLVLANNLTLEDLAEMKTVYTTEKYNEEYLYLYGNFPKNLSEIEIED